MKTIKEFKGTLAPIFTDDELKVKPTLDGDNQVHYLSINMLKPRENQPRQYINESTIQELAQSILSHGIIQPITVCHEKEGFYLIVAGERRWRAAILAGLLTVPALIMDLTEKEILAISLIENIQREDLNPIDEALAIKSLIDENLMTHAQVAEQLGRSRSAITNSLRLLDLHDYVKKLVIENKLEMGHARALVTLPQELQCEFAEKIIQKGLSVRDTEVLIHNMKRNHQALPTKNIVPDEKLKFWSEALSRCLSSDVTIKFNHNGCGKVVIAVNSPEEVEWLLERINKIKS